MSPFKILPVVAAIGALVAVDIGSAADAPSVSGQTRWTGSYSPVTVPGTGAGKTAVTVRAFTASNSGGRVTGRIYAYSR